MATATFGPYKGHTHEGLRSGKGRYKFSNAFYQYDGEWVDGVMHGEGTLKMSLRDGKCFLGACSSQANDWICQLISAHGEIAWNRRMRSTC